MVEREHIVEYEHVVEDEHVANNRSETLTALRTAKTSSKPPALTAKA